MSINDARGPALPFKNPAIPQPDYSGVTGQARRLFFRMTQPSHWPVFVSMAGAYYILSSIPVDQKSFETSPLTNRRELADKAAAAGGH